MNDKELQKELERLYSLQNIRLRKEEKQVATKEDLELETLKEELEGKRQDRKQRGKFAVCIFALMCCYLAVVLVIIRLKGIGLLSLENTVLNVLLTTTTANVIGIFIIVAKYLFHH